MSEIHSLSAELRERRGKGPARATRRAGRVPAVVYGNKQEPVLISLEPRALVRELHKASFFATLFDLAIAGELVRVLPRDVQFDPVTDRPLHADFLRVSADSKINVHVPVQFINDFLSPGIKRGGVLNVVRHEVELICPVEQIPHALIVDLEGLDIGDSVHISAIKLPEGVVPTIHARDFTVATIASPSAARAEAEEAAAAAAAAAAAPVAEGAEAPPAGAPTETKAS